MSGYHRYTNKSYPASKYERKQRILKLKSKEDRYPIFTFEDMADGTIYIHEASCLPVFRDRVPVEIDGMAVYKPTTKFGKEVAECNIGDSISASFYVKDTSKGKVIFDCRFISHIDIGEPFVDYPFVKEQV